MKLWPIEGVVPDGYGLSFRVHHDRDAPGRSERGNKRLYPLPGRVAFRVLLECCGFYRKWKDPVDFADKTLQVDTRDSSPEISDRLLRQHVHDPCSPVSTLRVVMSKLGHALTEIGCEEKVIVEQKHISFDVEISEG